MIQLALFAELELADAPVGAYGTVTGWGPDASPTTVTGWITQPARRHTIGIVGHSAHTPKFHGRPLLALTMDRASRWPGIPHGGSTGVYTAPDAVLRLIDPPADHPRPTYRHTVRRYPAQDLPLGAVWWLWNEPGQPRRTVDTAPQPLGAGRYRVSGLELPGDQYVDTEGQ